MKQNTATATATVDIPKGFLSSLLEYEQAGISRQAILALVQPELKEIDGQRKELRDSIAEQIKSLGAVDGSKVANILCASQHGDDNAARKRTQRRRDFMLSTLSRTFTSYDFSKDSGSIVASFVGDSSIREAMSLQAGLARLISLDLIGPASKSLARLSIQDIAQALRADNSADSANIETFIAVPENYLASITGRLNGLTQFAAQEAKLAQEANKVKVA